jgi:predicted PurR-regulated permease PerM
MTIQRTAALAGAAVLIWLALDFILLIFAGILLVILLRSLACLLADNTGLGVGRALAIVILTIVVVIGLAGWLYAPRLAEQVDQLTTSLPRAFNDLTSWMQRYAWGQWIVEQAEGATDNASMQHATTFLQSFTHLIVGVIVALFVGLYLAANPGPYIRGFLRLVPIPRRERAAEVLYAVGDTLRWWLFGQMVSMVLVGLAMGIGLGVIGVPLALLLGVLAGLFEFVPLVGPIMAVGPALLLALADSPEQAAWVLLLYSIVQTAEGYVITPLVQQRAVELPPVVTIAAQIALSWMAGPVGLLVAVPLVAVVMVMTQMLYVGDTLGDDMHTGWEQDGAEAVAQKRRNLLKGVVPPARPQRS